MHFIKLYFLLTLDVFLRFIFIEYIELKNKTYIKIYLTKIVLKNNLIIYNYVQFPRNELINVNKIIMKREKVKEMRWNTIPYL